jgi:hypothetical protein
MTAGLHFLPYAGEAGQDRKGPCAFSVFFA